MDSSSAVVKDLQAALFPLTSKDSSMTKFLERALRTNQVEINTDEKTSRAVAKLKEPRELFPGSGEPSELPRQAARWPAECHVVVERIRHLTWSPPHPEPYYKASGREIQPRPVGDQQGTVLFQYCPASHVNYFSRAITGGTRPPSCDITSPGCQVSARCTPGTGLIDGASPDDLRFESRFESGNLGKAVKITDTYYELSVRHDLYTNRHMQWFYFRVENMRPGIQYRFSIVNLCKAESLYRCGMRPLFYSEREASLRGTGWRRCGTNIAYYRNEYGSNSSGILTTASNVDVDDDDDLPSYTLTFCIEFPHSGDKAYLAHCYPYTYTDLQDDLLNLQNHPVKSRFCKLRLLCRSLAGNNVYYLTVTAPTLPEDTRRKKAVVLTARVHPGETPSSWMMKGFIDFLTGESLQARHLRDQFIFKLVPMLNPDGVIVGNSRCSLTGRDLNRQYRTVIRETYPPVWYTKLLVRRLLEDCGVEMYCDLHAHSRKHNIFIYGCENRRQGENRLQEQVFPLMLHKNSAEKFSFENCKFRIERSKEGTGRVVVWLMGVSNAFTMEASFGGSDLPGGRHRTHFSQHDFEAMARNFCETLIDYCDLDPFKERLRLKIMNRLLKEGSNSDEPINIELSDYSSDEGETSTSSDEVPWIDFSNPPPPVPPSSPALIRKARLKEKLQWDRSPPRPRKPLRVHTTKLEPEIDGNSVNFDSSNELSPSTRRRRIWEAQALRGGSPGPMPPELMVSSCSDQSNIATSSTKKRVKHKRKNNSRWHMKLLNNTKSSTEKTSPVHPPRLSSIWLPRLSHPSPPSIPVQPPSASFPCQEALLTSCSNKLSTIRLHRGLAVRRDRGKRKPPKESFLSAFPTTTSTTLSRITHPSSKTHRLGTVAAVAAAVAIVNSSTTSKANTKSSHKTSNSRRRKKESKPTMENSNSTTVVSTDSLTYQNEEQQKHKAFRKKIKRALKRNDKSRKT